MRKKLPIVLLLIILLAVYYFLAVDYLKQRQWQEQLNSQIAGAIQTLPQKPPLPPDLEQRLAVAQANLTAVESTFPGEINSTEVIAAILKLSEDVGIRAILLESSPWSREKNGEYGYYVLRLNVAVSGSFSQLEIFTDRLENGEFPTLIVEQLSVMKTEKQSGEKTVTYLTTPVSASLDLAIYSRSLPVD